MVMGTKPWDPAPSPARCPTCEGNAKARAENPAYPFCSPQCKLVDLGQWLDGAYRIPGPPDSDGET
jgi:uncharacterized protein